MFVSLFLFFSGGGYIPRGHYLSLSCSLALCVFLFVFLQLLLSSFIFQFHTLVPDTSGPFHHPQPKQPRNSRGLVLIFCLIRWTVAHSCWDCQNLEKGHQYTSKASFNASRPKKSNGPRMCLSKKSSSSKKKSAQTPTATHQACIHTPSRRAFS